MNEFALIDHYFANPAHRADQARSKLASAPTLLVGIGDDGAVIQANAREDWVLTTDTLIEGVHFLPDHPPDYLAERALAVNLSDINAMGATPFSCLLSITLPADKNNDSWLAPFSRAFHRYARKNHCALIGGNTTRGPLAINITAIGKVAHGRAILRSGGKAGDDVWVSGTIGLAHLGLLHLQGRINRDVPKALTKALTHAAIRAHQRPQPPLALGPPLIDLARAMMDVSDGLWQDAHHLAHASGVAVVLDGAALITSWPKAWRNALLTGDSPLYTQEGFLSMILKGGDDYQLLWSAPARHREKISALARALRLSVHRIGRLTPIGQSPKTPRVQVQLNNQNINADWRGYQHF